MDTSLNTDGTLDVTVHSIQALLTMFYGQSRQVDKGYWKCAA